MSPVKEFTIWSGWVLLMLAAIAPSFIVWFSANEGKIFPAVVPIGLEGIEYTEDGIIVYPVFDKKRDCGFGGVTWYKENGERVTYTTPGRNRNETFKRPLGINRAGPWTLHTDTLEGLTAIQESHCHPFWPVYSTFYQPPEKDATNERMPNISN